MTYTLEQLSADIKAALKADPGKGGKEAVCKLVSRVCLDKEFIARHHREHQAPALGARADQPGGSEDGVLASCVIPTGAKRSGGTFSSSTNE